MEVSGDVVRGTLDGRGRCGKGGRLWIGYRKCVEKGRTSRMTVGAYRRSRSGRCLAVASMLPCSCWSSNSRVKPRCRARAPGEQVLLVPGISGVMMQLGGAF